MIKFETLKFELCINHPDKNSLATIIIGDYSLDIIKKPKTRSYKVKPYDVIGGRKRYVPNLFEEYIEFPEFAGRDSLMVFLNELEREELDNDISELDQDLSEDEL